MKTMFFLHSFYQIFDISQKTLHLCIYDTLIPKMAMKILKNFIHQFFLRPLFIEENAKHLWTWDQKPQVFHNFFNKKFYFYIKTKRNP